MSSKSNKNRSSSQEPKTSESQSPVSKKGAIKLHESEIGHLKKKNAQMHNITAAIGLIQVAIAEKEADLETFRTAQKKRIAEYRDAEKGVQEWMKEFLEPKYGKGEIDLNTGEFIPDAVQTSQVNQTDQHPEGGLES